MSDESNKILTTLLSILPKETREFLGVYIMIFGPMIIIYGVVSLPKVIDSFIEPTEKCWEVKEIKGQVYRVNSCNGKVLPFEVSNEKK